MDDPFSLNFLISTFLGWVLGVISGAISVLVWKSYLEDDPKKKLDEIARKYGRWIRFGFEVVVLFVIPTSIGLIAISLLRSEESLPPLISLDPGESTAELEFGYYWVCTGDVKITSDVSDTVLDSESALPDNPGSAKETGIITTIYMYGVEKPGYPVSISVSSDGGANCVPADDTTLVEKQENAEELITGANAGEFCVNICLTHDGYIADIREILPIP